MAYSEQLERKTYIAGSTVVQYTGVPGFPGSIEPNVGSQYLIVKLDTTDKDVVQLATGTGTEIIAGVTTTRAQHARTGVAVAKKGRVPVQAGAALAYGAYVKPGTGGKAVAGTAGDHIGVVVEAASAAGVLATIDLAL